MCAPRVGPRQQSCDASLTMRWAESVAALTVPVHATPSIFSPASTPADSIYHLSLFVLTICGAIFLVVARPAGLRGGEVPTRAPTTTTASRRRSTAATRWSWPGRSFPILIVVVLFLATARVIHAVEDARFPPDDDWRSQRSATSSGGSFGIRSRGSSPPTSCTCRSAIRGHRDAHPHHAALGRHRSQLLGAATGRQDRPDSEPSEQHVDRAARDRDCTSASARSTAERSTPRCCCA